MSEGTSVVGVPSRRSFLATSGLVGAGLLATSCRGGDEQASEGGGAGNFPGTPRYNFVFVNHVTTNSFFTATRYGIEDASALLGTKFQWTGSKDSIVSEMVNAMNTAINGGADGIAISIVDPNAFNDPIKRALGKGIPVVAYNANGAVDESNPALAYVGQDLYTTGVKMGKRIAQTVKSGKVTLFIATPGQLNIQPRIDGAKAGIKRSGANLEVHEVATGAQMNEELNRIDSYYQGHKDVNGMFAVDAGSTKGLAQVMKKYGLAEKGIKAGGFDLLPTTLDGIKNGHLEFTIDQQAYLQGFDPVMQLYLFHVSGGLVSPADTNTSLKFVTKENVDPYLATKTRYEGSTQKQKIVQSPDKIQVPSS